jgi:hypothetical protein
MCQIRIVRISTTMKDFFSNMNCKKHTSNSVTWCKGLSLVEKNITGETMLNAWCKGLCHLWKNIYKTWINHLFMPNRLQCPSQCRCNVLL